MQEGDRPVVVEEEMREEQEGNMQAIYAEIQQILQGPVGSNLGMESSRVTYVSKDDPGESVPGYTVRGVSETIEIPDEYMSQAGASNAVEFLNWLRSQ